MLKLSMNYRDLSKATKNAIPGRGNMHSLVHKLNISLFKKIITIFLIVIAPIFILGIYIRNWGANTVREELSKSSTAQIEFI